MSKPFLDFEVADFSNTNKAQLSLAEIRRDSYTEGFIKGKAEGRADAIDEVLQVIHNIYTQGLHCMADYCEKDIQGYDCEDCLYNSVKQNLEQLKSQK